VRASLREHWLFWLLTAFVVNQAAMNLVRPMVSYRALAIGVDAAGLGVLSAAFSVAPLVVALRLGRLVDVRGERGFLFCGTVLMGVVTIGLAFTGSIPLLYVLFMLFGLGHLAMTVSTQAMVARGSDERSYDQRFSAFSLSASVGQLAGPAIAGIVAGQGSLDETSTALGIGAALALGTVLVLLLVRSPETVRPPKEKGARGPSLMSILRTPGVARAILVSTTVLSAIDIIVIYMPALGEERLWSASLVGVLLAIRAGSSMAMRVVLGRLAARFGRPILLSLSMAVSAVALVAIPFTASVPGTVLLMVATGAGLGIGQPMTMSWVASLAAPGARATALSVRLMGNRMGQVALPVAVGSVAAFAGAGGVLGATGLFVALSLAGVYGGLGVRKSAEERERAGEPGRVEPTTSEGRGR
jgi:MFS family permease